MGQWFSRLSVISIPTSMTVKEINNWLIDRKHQTDKHHKVLFSDSALRMYLSTVDGKKDGVHLKRLLVSLIKYPTIFQRCWDSICIQADLFNVLGFSGGKPEGSYLLALLVSLNERPALFQRCWDSICAQPDLFKALGLHYNQKNGCIIYELLVSLRNQPRLFERCWDRICAKPYLFKALGLHFNHQGGGYFHDLFILLRDYPDLYQLVMQRLVFSQVCFRFVAQEQLNFLADVNLKNFLTVFKKQLALVPITQADYLLNLFIFVDQYPDQSTLPPCVVKGFNRQPTADRAEVMQSYIQVAKQPVSLTRLCACSAYSIFNEGQRAALDVYQKEQQPDQEESKVNLYGFKQMNEALQLK